MISHDKNKTWAHIDEQYTVQEHLKKINYEPLIQLLTKPSLFDSIPCPTTHDAFFDPLRQVLGRPRCSISFYL